MFKAAIIFLRRSFFFSITSRKLTPESSKITTFSSVGGHFSTSKNDPRSLFCGVHYSSLHQQELTIFRCFLHYNCVPNCHIHLTARNDRKRSTSGPKQNTPKGRGLGINSSQSKNVGKIQISMQLSHLNIIFVKIHGFNDYNKNQFLACEELTCLCIMRPSFVFL